MGADFWASVIVGILGFIGSLAAVLIGNSKTTALVTYRLEQLETKVSLHNNAVERLYKVEQEQAVQKARIDDLEKDIDK